MKVLFAVSNDNITTSVVNRYQQKFKEIITSKNVYYFNAIIKELQRDKSYDAIVIGEDLEPISNNNYASVDKFLYEKLDIISDEATKPNGTDISIIFICSDRRTSSDELLTELYGIGIYNALIGRDRSIDMVCNLINKPRSKREAKDYYRITPDKKINIGPSDETIEKDVSESEIQNIINHYKKIGTNVKKCVESFDSIAEQYNETQLRVIIKFLPNEVKAILENNSAKYQKLISKGTVLTNGKYAPYERQSDKKPGSLDFLAKDLEKTTMSKPVVIPSSIRFNKIPDTQFPNAMGNTINQASQSQNPVMQGVNNNGEIQQMNNNQVNNDQGIPEIAIKRGRGRPRKIDTVNNGLVVQNQDIHPLEQNATVEPKRKRGRPPKQTVVPTPTQGQYTTNTPIQEQVVSQSNGQQNIGAVEAQNPYNQQEQNINPFEDVLPGLEENDDMDLFNMDTSSSTDKTTEEVMLPGFDNDIENIETNNEENTDTNLFDLDIEDNSSFENNYNTNNNIYNQTADNSNLFNTDMYNQNPYNQNPYNQVNNTNQMPEQLYNKPNNIENSYNQPNNIENSYNQPNNIENPYNQTNNIENSYNKPNVLTEANNAHPTMMNNVIAGNGKIVAFVGTTKNGTSFIVNNLAQLLSQSGVKTAILDLTKNKNSYYMFTDNDANLMKKATDSIKNLSSGIVDGLNVNKNLTVFTSLPEGFDEPNRDVMLKTLSNSFEVALLDCDFNTAPEYFTAVNEIYLVQTMDTFTIQPLTQFLSDLKLKNILDESKLRIVLNKYVRLKRLDENLIIGGMSKYNEPSMTLQRDLFNAQTIKRVLIPFEMDTYARYLESIAMCNLSLNGYSQNFLKALEELKNMVYPLVSGGNRSQNNTQEKNGLFGSRKNKGQVQSTQFSNNVNDTLNRMRTNNF